MLTVSPLGGLGSGTGGCSAATHVGSAAFMSSLLTELSSCGGTVERGKIKICTCLTTTGDFADRVIKIGDKGE